MAKNKVKNIKSNNSELFERDCIDGMKELEADSIHAVITDPPYGLEFMGKEWDTFKETGDSKLLGNVKEEGGFSGCDVKPGFKVLPRYNSDSLQYQKFTTDWATEAFRVLKPGGYLLSFGGTRTYHRMTCGIEDAGFDIRDCVMWLYGSGFPKGLNIGKKVIGWEGWNTNLKPAVEPIVMARKPFKGSVVDNVLQHDTGGINIDACRIDTEEKLGRKLSKREEASSVNCYEWSKRPNPKRGEFIDNTKGLGRYPSNVIIDEFVAGEIDKQSGITESKPHKGDGKKLDTRNQGWGFKRLSCDIQDKGGASRFFYVPKVSAEERNMGCGKLEKKANRVNAPRENEEIKTSHFMANHHPTVKPLELMRYLVKMVTREGHMVLDPFVGSGSTLIACKQLGRDYVGFEKDPNYVKIANARLKAVVTLRDWF